ncbi:hypothetical protein [Lysinibacillus xylanilyticus]|uniref:hypothetical protein n=1 Tax=Lysinibacillus xylanilyticus TaxID=582475 RepID=UPI003810BC57
MSRLGQQDVGHEGVITGRDGFSLRSSIADPQGVAQPPLQSTNIHDICFYKCHPQLLMMSKKKPLLKQQKALKETD